MDARELWAAHTGFVPVPANEAGESCELCHRASSEVPGLWHMSSGGIESLCADCLGNFHSMMRPAAQRGNVVWSECCCCYGIYRISDGLAITQNNRSYNLYFQCAGCYAAGRLPGVNIRQPHHQTSDGVVLQLQPLPTEAYTVPPEIASAVTAFGNSQFIDDLDECVRQIPGNVLEWTQFSDDDGGEDVDGTISGLLVNCVQPGHPVGSIAIDDHGRVGMDKLYDSFQQYQEARQAWQAAKAALAAAGEQPGDESPYCARTFAKYARMAAGLPFNLG